MSGIKTGVWLIVLKLTINFRLTKSSLHIETGPIMLKSINPSNSSTTTRSTKERIFHVALDLFYESCFEKVSIRDIADAAHVKVPTIYNHFESKEDILKSLYDFYDIHWQEAVPDLDELLRLSETESPHAVLMKTDLRFDPAIEQTMNRILAVAVREINFERSATFLKEKILGQINDSLRPLLEHMIKFHRIEPLNVETFLSLSSSYAFSAALLNGTPFQTDLDSWKAGMEMLFSIIKPTKDFGG